MKQSNVFVIQERDLTPTPSLTLPKLPAKLIHPQQTLQVFLPGCSQGTLTYLSLVKEALPFFLFS